MTKDLHLKDEVMHQLVKDGVNVAQFVSFAPSGAMRYACVRGHDGHGLGFEGGVRAVYSTGVDMINIRTFKPEKPDGNPFFLGSEHGFSDPCVAAEKIAEMCRAGYHVIVNEYIDPSDGGFSGVAMGNVVEFAACDVPRCVERETDVPCAALSRSLTRRLVYEGYQFNLVFPFDTLHRIEFSVHPNPVGYFGEKMVIWQAEPMKLGEWRSHPVPYWPNRFSTHFGDKAWGLLMAYLHDFPVPHTEVDGRVVPPFRFGTDLRSKEGWWTRTCPRVQEPGRFPTLRGYHDPFKIMTEWDPDGSRIASMINQHGVAASYSGATITSSSDSPIIEGRAGRGDKFMTGQVSATILPRIVHSAVTALWCELRETFGVVRFEWAYDSSAREIWVLQLHGGGSPTIGDTIYPGEVLEWRDFKVPGDLEELRELSKQAMQQGFGIRLLGNVGLTSHPCDILRRDKVTSRLCRSA